MTTLPPQPPRRRWLAGLGALLGSAGALSGARAAAAGSAPKADRMPGDPPEHRIVYQLDQADAEYIEHILGSIGALITKYEDNVEIAVVVFGRGIHLLAKKPVRPIPEELRQRAAAQSRDYGVHYIACGNTMKSMNWGAKDMLDFATIEDVGAASLMERQEKGWAYVAW